MARQLKSGKIAVKLNEETIAILSLAVQQRLHFDELPDFLYYLLQEALEKLQRKTCKLRKSEFFAVFQEDTMVYIDIPTQLLIRQAVELELKEGAAFLYLPIAGQDETLS